MIHATHFSIHLCNNAAVKLFFRVTWDHIDLKDHDFIMEHYFLGQFFERKPVSLYEYYAQCRSISALFGYTNWSAKYQQSLYEQAVMLMHRDANPSFIAMELLSYLQNQSIIRPGYTTLQKIVSTVINQERKRLAHVIKTSLSTDEKQYLDALLLENESLSRLAAIKQDARDFNRGMMVQERKKMALLKPLYQLIKQLMPTLALSEQNRHHYAEMVQYYTIHELRERLKPEQSYLYLLCYAWKRYQQLNDNIVNAFCFHIRKIDSNIRELSKKHFSEYMLSQHQTLLTMKRLVQFYVDESLSDNLHFGDVRQKAFLIVPKETLKQITSSGKKPLNQGVVA